MAELAKTYKEILLTRKELAKLGDEKRDLYEKKKQLYTEIKDLLEKLKKLREKRQEYTRIIDGLMEERTKTLESINNIKKELSSYDQKLKEINKNKELIENINKYKKELEMLENVLQTEILSYSQEKKIWYRIKYLRRLLGKYEALAIYLKELDEKKKELSALKSKLVIIGTNIRKNIEERKAIKEEIKKIKEELKKKIDEYNQIKNRISEIKQKISELEKKLEDLLSKYVGDLEKTGEVKIGDEEKKEIVDAYNKIQEKILNGGEITMDEILILQKYEILKRRGLI